MPQFLTEKTLEGNLKVVNLIDKKNSVQVKIIPELGNNLVSLSIEKNEIIYIPDKITNLKAYQFYGNPILFPFPGRIPQGKFSFQGQDYQLPINFSDGTAIHGFVYDKSWEISETSSDSDEGAVLKSIYKWDTQTKDSYPSQFEVEMIYILRESELEMIFKATNTGNKSFPFGYGLHPYFMLPGKRKDWVLYFPANKTYELVNIRPTGKTLDIPAQFDFRNEKSLEGVFMDDLFGELKKEQGAISCWLRNLSTNFKLTVSSDENFDYYVLYAPKEHNFICIEPYTCIANAFNLANSEIETGLRTLVPDETFHAKIKFEWEV